MLKIKLVSDPKGLTTFLGTAARQCEPLMIYTKNDSKFYKNLETGKIFKVKCTTYYY